MRWSILLAVLLVVPGAAAQLPHPHDSMVHHPLTIQAEMEAIRDVSPDIISMESFGTSVAGFDLWALDFHHPDAPDDAPVYYLDANHHGNEQLGMEALLIFMEELAQWSFTEEGAARLQEVRVVAAPMINPDGTGRDNRVNTKGVDLNRNYDYNWGLYGTGSMANPATGNYRGDAPLSEPESSANADLMEVLRPDLYLSMHTGSHDIVLPWRQEPDADGPMPDWSVYKEWLGHIENVSGLGYRDPSGAGESISYAYGMFGAMSLIVEVDTTQNQLVITDIPGTLKEEVAIYWDSLHRLESYGGWLVEDNSTLVNQGLGPAYNVTLLPGGHGDHEHGHDEDVVVAEMLMPNQTLEASSGTYTYERRAQGDAGVPVWRVHVVGSEEPSTESDDAAVPFPAPLVIAVLVGALLLRRR